MKLSGLDARHWITACAAGAIIYACIPAAAPVDLGVCVAIDALKGDSVPQIMDDCKADLAAVLAALLSSKSKEVIASSAYAEALKAKAVLQPLPLDAGATP